MNHEAEREFGRDDRGHPLDRLADLVHGRLSEPEAASVQAHLSACARCRDDVEVLRALACAPAPVLSDVERELAWGAFARRRRKARLWPAGSWRVAAAVAIVVTGVGVWRLNAGTEAGGLGDVAVGRVLAVWARDVDELQVDAPEVSLALGYAADPAPAASAWEGADPADVSAVVGPWEEPR